MEKSYSQYVDRFAPSPTGHLHFGSLVATLGSYLDAKHNQGKWLVRIENVDSTRCKLDYQQSILDTLTHFGFYSDDEILIQSQQLSSYQQALDELNFFSYVCNCSRKYWQTTAKKGLIGFIYPRLCKHKKQNNSAENLSKGSTRLALPDERIHFIDRRLGTQSYHYQQHIGDPILKRNNNDFAYALAVCVDDNKQNVTHIVRGQDLLVTTPIQLFIQQQLNYPTPQYLHLPLALDKHGKKLSKQNHAKPITQSINQSACYQLIIDALILLKQKTPRKSSYSDCASLISFATENWQVPESSDNL